jgi:hypothetical protein
VSGSGKSTLAFDILFNEGQRRYLESLNAYARSLVQPAGRPEVDAVYGIPPTVAIEQRLSRGGRKSTVGTTTEVHHFLRLLFVKLGTQHCTTCVDEDGHPIPVLPQTPEAIAAQWVRDYRGQHIGLMAPLVVNRKGIYTELAKWASSKGFDHLRVDGEFSHSRLGHRQRPEARPLPRTLHRIARGRRGGHPRERAPPARAAGPGAGTRQGCGPPHHRAGRPGRGAGHRQVHPAHGPRQGVLHRARLPQPAAPATPSWTRACSATTASTAGARTAWARAWR